MVPDDLVFLLHMFDGPAKKVSSRNQELFNAQLYYVLGTAKRHVMHFVQSIPHNITTSGSDVDGFNFIFVAFPLDSIWKETSIDDNEDIQIDQHLGIRTSILETNDGCTDSLFLKNQGHESKCLQQEVWNTPIKLTFGSV